MVAQFSSRLRTQLWRTVCSLAGGLTVTGSMPRSETTRGRIVVANHASHADTAALLAGLPASHQPVFAAAADYWFDIWWRRWLITGLAGGLPVQRTDHGAYEQLRAAAQPALAAGKTVVIYPEGTRSTDGTVGRFHSGAVRLARDCEVDLVPVAVLGTGDVLAKHGRFRTRAMELRIGAPVCGGDAEPEVLRQCVVDLIDRGPATARRSSTWGAVERITRGSSAAIFGFVWGYAEAISWPVMAEMALVFVGASAPRRIPVMAGAIAAGSVCGVLTTAALARRGMRAPAPLTTPRMHRVARHHLRHGPIGIWRQALDGIPVKVYARAAGELGLPPGRLALAAAGARSARMGACAAGIGAAAVPLQPTLRRLYGPYLALTTTGFVVILRRIVRAWG